jgi:predicted dienelactone hydrolase
MVRSLTVAAALAVGMSVGYDPLAVMTPHVPRTLDVTVADRHRSRDLPILVYLPTGTTAAPVILFSHGLGGSRHGSKYLGEHWARRGYVAVFLQHPGSDDGVWRDRPIAGRMAAMRGAASAANFLLRVKDVPAVLDRLEQWNRQEGHALKGRMDLGRVGMSGHSFGAVTTQAVSGQAFGGLGPLYTDRRIKAAIAFSPSSPRGRPAGQTFGKVAIPWMLMTGTRDTAVIGDATVESRLAVFPALPSGDKYELVLHDAEHSAFADRALPGYRIARNPNHPRAILALSTAFWDAYLGEKPDARRWLQSALARTVLDTSDGWQVK